MPDGRRPMMQSGRAARPLAIGALASASYVVLAVLVATGRTKGIDDEGYQVFRPGGVWGPAQLLTGNVVDGIQPRIVVGMLILLALWTARRWRSWRPLEFVVALCAGIGIVTVLSKFLIERADPAGVLTPGHGSFPSGHAASIIVCLAGAAMLMHARMLWWEWATVVVIAGVMAASLLFVGLHWVSDVVGGTLLGVAVVSVVSVSPLRRYPRHGDAAIR